MKLCIGQLSLRFVKRINCKLKLCAGTLCSESCTIQRIISVLNISENCANTVSIICFISTSRRFNDGLRNRGNHCSSLRLHWCLSCSHRSRCFMLGCARGSSNHWKSTNRTHQRACGRLWRCGGTLRISATRHLYNLIGCCIF